jgi:transposase
LSFVAVKTSEQSDLLLLHHAHSRLVRQRTAIVNQIRGFRIERGITVAARSKALAQRADRSLGLTP